MVDDVARARLRPPPAELELLEDTLTDELLLLLDRLELDAEARRRRRSERALTRPASVDREQRSMPFTASPVSAATKAAAPSKVEVISMIAAPDRQRRGSRQEAASHGRA